MYEIKKVYTEFDKKEYENVLEAVSKYTKNRLIEIEADYLFLIFDYKKRKLYDVFYSSKSKQPDKITNRIVAIDFNSINPKLLGIEKTLAIEKYIKSKIKAGVV